MSLHSILATVVTILLIPTTISFAIVKAVPHTTTTALTSRLDSKNNRCSTTDQSTIENSSCPAVDDIMTTPLTLRSVQKILPRPSPHWVGDGFRVYPVFSNLAFTNELSPLLMFDYAEPHNFPPSPNTKKPLGVGQHPHRGFETVTIAFQGEVEHHDNTGKTGVIQAGDVQWMTAGRGIIHEEYHSKNFTQTGGTFEMCQLWVNLPKKYKMSKPSHQGIQKESIPIVNLPLGSNDETALGSARIIAGEIGETKGAAQTFSPVQVWDVNVPLAGSEIDIPFPANQNCLIFARRGSMEVLQENGSNKILKPQEVALMHKDGNSNTVRIRAIDSDSSILILGGESLDEPIAAQGPFVMNTQEEIYQAMSDYRSGKFVA
jgi:quercetin 2,3-dioxygenase